MALHKQKAAVPADGDRKAPASQQRAGEELGADMAPTAW